MPELDEQAYEIIPGLFTRLDEMIERYSQQIDEVNEIAELYQVGEVVGTILGLLIFGLLALLALLLIHLQVNTPLRRLSEAVAQIECGDFDPASLQKMAARRDEIGAIAGELIKTAAQLAQRRAGLEKEARTIRSKIK